jgi:hypothetical protein
LSAFVISLDFLFAEIVCDFFVTDRADRAHHNAVRPNAALVACGNRIR